MPSRALVLVLCLALVPSASCLLPSGGTPVLVDSLAGDYWSGEGQLLQVSDDHQHCRVAVRSRAVIVREEWVPCTSVHPTHSR